METFEETDRALYCSGKAYLLHSSTCFSLIASYEGKEKRDCNSSRSIISCVLSVRIWLRKSGSLGEAVGQKEEKTFPNLGRYLEKIFWCISIRV